MASRIKEVRESRHLIQEIVANEIGVTQQAFSKYERDITNIKVDVLIKLAEYFNVTTDYLLGLSDVKRDLQRQVEMNKDLDEYYELIEAFKSLDNYDKELLWNIVQKLKETSIKRKKNTKEGTK
ncbi:helix-turn-helix domain-containing protein [Dorea sp.]|jgi:transcriptional regulator with XRE-family HTH domain|uniref:helix-turn-helix domain-containing protein n=1 Tax=Dorea sp. TaxID=2040332 RepID=UPI003527FDB1